MGARFRGFLPVVVDVETSGFDPVRHAVLEIAALTLRFERGALVIDARHQWPVRPFAEAEIAPDSLRVTGIDLNDPKRGAIAEAEAIKRFFKIVRGQIKAQGCHRGVLVAHNAVFDAAFLRSAAKRANAKRDPFHPIHHHRHRRPRRRRLWPHGAGRSLRTGRHRLQQEASAQRPLRRRALRNAVLQDRQQLGGGAGAAYPLGAAKAANSGLIRQDRDPSRLRNNGDPAFREQKNC